MVDDETDTRERVTYARSHENNVQNAMPASGREFTGNVSAATQTNPTECRLAKGSGKRSRSKSKVNKSRRCGKSRRKPHSKRSKHAVNRRHGKRINVPCKKLDPALIRKALGILKKLNYEYSAPDQSPARVEEEQQPEYANLSRNARNTPTYSAA